MTRSRRTRALLGGALAVISLALAITPAAADPDPATTAPDVVATGGGGAPPLLPLHVAHG